MEVHPFCSSILSWFLVSFPFYINFSIGLSISIKKFSGIWIGITVNPQMNILPILSLIIIAHSIFLHLLRPLISVNNVLYFLAYRSLTYFSDLLCLLSFLGAIDFSVVLVC